MTRTGTSKNTDLAEKPWKANCCGRRAPLLRKKCRQNQKSEIFEERLNNEQAAQVSHIGKEKPTSNHYPTRLRDLDSIKRIFRVLHRRAFFANICTPRLFMYLLLMSKWFVHACNDDAMRSTKSHQIHFSNYAIHMSTVIRDSYLPVVGCMLCALSDVLKSTPSNLRLSFHRSEIAHCSIAQFDSAILLTNFAHYNRMGRPPSLAYFHYRLFIQFSPPTEGDQRYLVTAVSGEQITLLHVYSIDSSAFLD